MRALLGVRDALVRTRTRYVAMMKASVRREGLRIPSGDAEHTVTKLLALPLPAHVFDALAPLIALWTPLNAQIELMDERLIALAKEHPAITRLRSMPSIAGRRFRLPDGSERYLVDEAQRVALTGELGGRLLDPLKTTVVQDQRCMTTWVCSKSRLTVAREPSSKSHRCIV